MLKPKLYLLNGPLGAGKTTFLRFLLNQPQFAKARVIENEFASVSVDTQSLHAHTAEIATIAGVCVCCSDGDELVSALARLARDSHQPVIIEATGVANSLQLVEKLVASDVLDKYELAQGVFVLDASELTRELETALAQYESELLAADLVLVSKSDLVSTKQAEAIFTYLETLGANNVHKMNHGEIDTRLIGESSEMLERFADINEELVAHDLEVNYTVLDLTRDLNPETLKSRWPQLQTAYNLRRLKGDIFDGKKYWHVEATPAQLLASESHVSDAKLIAIGGDARKLTEDGLFEALSDD